MRSLTAAKGDLLVIGVGNVLLRDDGAGVRVAELAGRVHDGRPAAFPPRTRIVDGGTLGLDLLPMLEDARAVVLIDAVDLRGSPGDVAVLHGEALQGTLYHHVSPHQVGVGDLLAAGRLTGRLPGQIALVGIQPGEISIGLDLTDAVEAALPRAAELAGSIAWELDRALRAGGGPGGTTAGNAGGTPAARAG